MWWTCWDKGGISFGSYVQSIGVLDRYFCSHVLCWWHVYYVLTFLRSNWFFPVVKLLEVIRTHVYLYFRCILNYFLRRLYLLDDLYDGIRYCWPLIWYHLFNFIKKGDGHPSLFFISNRVYGWAIVFQIIEALSVEGLHERKN